MDHRRQHLEQRNLQSLNPIPNLNIEVRSLIWTTSLAGQESLVP